MKQAGTPKPLPNLWLKDALSKAPVRHDWLAPLAYRKVARYFGNSSEGTFAAGPCWFIALSESSDIAEEAFKGIFLTEKGGLGFRNRGQIARFNNGVAFIGSVESAHEGIDVNLVGIGVNGCEQIAFIVSDDYRNKFEIPEATWIELLKQLREGGALIMSISEILADSEAIEVIWTLPTEHPDPANPQVLEMRRPSG